MQTEEGAGVNLAAAMLLSLRGWMPLIQHEARAAHVDTMTLAAIVWHESRGNPGAFFQERGEACSVGLGGVYVPGCAPSRVAALKDPAYNLRISAKILAANQRWCRAHRYERRCAAGERVFKGGGGVNCYGGNSVRFAGEVLKIRRVLVRALVSRSKKRQHHRAV